MTLEGTVLAAAQALAQSSGTALEEAVVELARRGASSTPAPSTVIDSYSPLPRMTADDAAPAREPAPEVRGT